MPQEIELKFSITPKTIPALRRHPLLKQAGKPVRRKLVSTYFDTPQLALRKQNYAYRVREMRSRWVQTLKGGGEIGAGVHQRDEWECESPDGLPAWDRFSDERVAKILKPSVTQKLVPLFVTDFWRTAWSVQLANGAEIEVALDQGEVRNDQHAVPICEVELELKTGKPGDLFDVALDLFRDTPAMLENVSKAARGYALSDPTEPALVKSGAIRGASSEPYGSWRAIFTDCLGQFQGNAAGVVATDDPEYVHQMRIGLRRLKAAVRLFIGSEFKLPEHFPYLGSVGDLLGQARDWDIFVSMLSSVPPNENKDWGGLIDVATLERKRAREGARAAIESPEFTRVVLLLGKWIADLPDEAEIPVAHGEVPSVSSGDEQTTLDDARKQSEQEVARLLGAQAKALRRKGGNHPECLPPDKRHRVRIHAKRLRYAVEFFGDRVGRSRRDRYWKAVKGVQDILGLMNDYAVVAEMINAPPVKGKRALCLARGVLRGWLLAQEERTLKKLPKAWKKWRSQDAYWPTATKEK